jgi:hypothetical protein
VKIPYLLYITWSVPQSARLCQLQMLGLEEQEFIHREKNLKASHSPLTDKHQQAGCHTFHMFDKIWDPPQLTYTAVLCPAYIFLQLFCNEYVSLFILTHLNSIFFAGFVTVCQFSSSNFFQVTIYIISVLLHHYNYIWKIIPICRNYINFNIFSAILRWLLL